MTLDQECALSFYREISQISSDHNVWLVQHTVSGHLYVKKLLQIYDINVYKYLKDEHIADTPVIHELIETEDGLYVIEEYLSGETLKEILERGRLPENKAVDIIMQLCMILQKLHESPLHIVHRDIKPSNIIISPEGCVRLLDMNAAKVIDRNSSQDTNLIGTFHYAAPEQFGFGPSDARTDIYALGVLLNQMLTGHFPGEVQTQGRLRQVIEKCTKLEPSERYDSVRALRAALERYSTDEYGAACYAEKMQDRSKPESDGLSDLNSQGEVIRLYLPLGFRTLKPYKMVIAGILYALFMILGLTLRVSSDSSVVIWLNRIGLLISFSASFMVCTNWMNMWGWTKKRVWLRVILTVAVVFLIFFFTIVIISEITERI